MPPAPTRAKSTNAAPGRFATKKKPYWSNAKRCLTAELEALGKARRVEADAATDGFSRKILAYCRGQSILNDKEIVWRNVARCQQRQAEAGQAVAKLYRAAGPASLKRKAMDSCAGEHRTRAGHYNWRAVHNCIKGYLRR